MGALKKTFEQVYSALLPGEVPPCSYPSEKCLCELKRDPHLWGSRPHGLVSLRVLFVCVQDPPVAAGFVQVWDLWIGGCIQLLYLGSSEKLGNH